jgi:dTMP kinase
MRGRLVVFEGGEGAGKTTQLRRLADRLAAEGTRHRTFREPGGTPVGDRIREILLHHEGPLAPAAEAALFVASRAQLVATEVRPALERGEHVLLDRFLLSTYAYQIHGRGLDESAVREANRLATAGLAPDLTILLALTPVEGLARAVQRGAVDRIEGAAPAFHARVAAAFDTFATEAWQRGHPECGRIVAVDATGTVDEVGGRVAATVSRHLPELVREAAAR